MSDPVEDAADMRPMSWRDCARMARGVQHELEALRAMALAGFTGDEDPNPDSYPGEG